MPNEANYIRIWYASYGPFDRYVSRPGGAAAPREGVRGPRYRIPVPPLALYQSNSTNIHVSGPRGTLHTVPTIVMNENR